MIGCNPDFHNHSKASMSIDTHRQYTSGLFHLMGFSFKKTRIWVLVVCVLLLTGCGTLKSEKLFDENHNTVIIFSAKGISQNRKYLFALTGIAPPIEPGMVEIKMPLRCPLKDQGLGHGICEVYSSANHADVSVSNLSTTHIPLRTNAASYIIKDHLYLLEVNHGISYCDPEEFSGVSEGGSFTVLEDGKEIVFVEQDDEQHQGTIIHYDYATCQAIDSSIPEENLQGILISKNGCFVKTYRRLALVKGQYQYISFFSVYEPEEEELILSTNGIMPQLSPTGQFVSFINEEDAALHIIDLHSQNEFLHDISELPTIVNYGWYDEENLVLLSRDNNIFVLNLVTEKVSLLYSASPDLIIRDFQIFRGD